MSALDRTLDLGHDGERIQTGDRLQGQALGARAARPGHRRRRTGVEVVLPAARRRARGGGGRPRARAVDRRRLRELERAQQAVAARGDAVPYLGELLHVRAEPGRARVHRRGDELLARPAPSASPRWSAGTGGRRATEIAPRLDRACALAGSSYTKLTIRGQRTRWASCSRDGRDELQLAAAARARAGARLRRLARGLPPGGDGPLAAVLGAAGSAGAPTTASSRAGCAATARRWCCDAVRGPAAARSSTA